MQNYTEPSVLIVVIRGQFWKRITIRTRSNFSILVVGLSNSER